MFKHLFVPLDGSLLAEQALPAASFIAEHMGASITLIHVIEEDAPSQIHGERHLQTPDEAEQYLKQLATTAFSTRVKVDYHVHSTEVKNVAKSIVEHAGEFVPDLIVMCAHGHGGLRDFLYGSIAQQIIAYGHTPVMIIFPTADQRPVPFTCGNILIPLDGKPEHETGLPLAISLAKECGRNLHLLLVVPTLSTLKGTNAAAGTLLPASMSVLLDLSEEAGGEYLTEKAQTASDAGIEVSAEVIRGDPVSGIIKAAQQNGANLIVIGTHGRSGSEAFWAGSIAPRISSQSHIPLLLVPASVHE
jgi:nucleotide-binding universal stress UspA family protein